MRASEAFKYNIKDEQISANVTQTGEKTVLKQLKVIKFNNNQLT